MGFRFTIKLGPDDEGRGVVKTKSKIRETDNWFEVPVSAIPILEEGWPEMPDYMDARQYFLWWKNNFIIGKGESPFDGPILWDPNKPDAEPALTQEEVKKKYTLENYPPNKLELGGETSRRWGA